MHIPIRIFHMRLCLPITRVVRIYYATFSHFIIESCFLQRACIFNIIDLQNNNNKWFFTKNKWKKYVVLSFSELDVRYDRYSKLNELLKWFRSIKLMKQQTVLGQIGNSIRKNMPTRFSIVPKILSQESFQSLALKRLLRCQKTIFSPT